LNSYAYRSLPPKQASSDPLKIKKPAKEKTRE
jgi:hypothetical protein